MHNHTGIATKVSIPNEKYNKKRRKNIMGGGKKVPFHHKKGAIKENVPLRLLVIENPAISAYNPLSQTPILYIYYSLQTE